MENKELIEALIKERDGHLKIANEHNKIADSINITISALKGKPIPESNNNNNLHPKDKNYKPSWQISEKIVFFLKRENRFLHNREFCEMAHNEEPHIKTEDFQTSFSSALSRLKREGQITSKKFGSSLRNVFWGRNEWVNENGEILSGHEINEDYMYDKDKSKINLFGDE